MFTITDYYLFVGFTIFYVKEIRNTKQQTYFPKWCNPHLMQNPQICYSIRSRGRIWSPLPKHKKYYINTKIIRIYVFHMFRS